MKNIEIILVNDFSTDDSLSYIQELQKEDPRIKIINNQKNMGTLYSRSIGVLSAKGKYIFPLDNGDMFLDYDVFDTISEVAEKDNYDIVEFKAINVGGLFDLPNQRLLNIMFSGHPLNLVLTQPDLGYFPMQPKNETGQFSIVDNYIWNKCIKTEIYQKGLNLFGEERYKRHMTYHEDLIIVILLFNVADTYKFIGKYGVLNVPNSGSGMKGQTTMNLYEMYLIDCMIDFSKDIKENKKIIVQYMITLLGRDMLEQTLKEGDNKKLFDSMLERIANCKYISEEDKNEISNRAVKFK
jgi:glycosyltransferase involved in cell wall biosynthesis